MTGTGNIGRRRTIDVLAAALALAAFVLSLIVVLTQEEDGPAWFAPLIFAIPAVVAFLPIVLREPARHMARVAAMVTRLAVCFVFRLSVGIYFFPSLILMTISAVRRR